MSTQLTAYRVFIASPGGLQDERQAFREVLRAYNEEEAIPRGVLFIPVGWEDVLGGLGRPQSRINEDIRECDHFLLMLWDRWGSSPDAKPGPYTAATQEEYELALRCLEPRGMLRTMVILFKAVEAKQFADPGAQLLPVLEFKKEIERQRRHFFETFDSVDGFSRLLRRHAGQWMRDHTQRLAQPRVLPDSAEAQPAAPGLRGPLLLPPVDEGILNASALAESGHLADAEVAFARMSVSDPSPSVLVHYARFLMRGGRLAQAGVMLDRAESMAQDGRQDDVSLASVYSARGDLFDTQGSGDEAERMYRQAIAILEGAGCTEAAADALIPLGALLRKRGDFAGAEDLYRRSLAVNVPLDRRQSMAPAYMYLGSILRSREQYDQAREMLTRALSIYEGLHNREGTASVYGKLANLEVKTGQLERAGELYGKALAIEEERGHLAGQAIVVGNLSILHTRRNELERAEDMARRALELNQRIGRPVGEAIAYANLASVLMKRKDYRAAEEKHRQSLAIFERLHDLEGLATGYENLADARCALGDATVARELYAKSAELYDRLGIPGAAAAARVAVNKDCPGPASELAET